MTPDLCLFTDMDSQSYEDSGLEWVRAVKSLGILHVSIAVINHGLTDDQYENLDQMKHVKVLEPVVFTGCQTLDAWNAIPKYATSPAGYCDLSHRPCVNALACWGRNGVGAYVGSLNQYKLLSPLVAIESRVKLSKAIEENVVAKLGGYLLPGLVLATQEDWRHLCGMGNLLLETGVTDSLPGLRALNLNLYAAYGGEVQILAS